MKPGQLCMLNDHLFRAKHKKCGCEGCYFEDAWLMCPSVTLKNRNVKKIDCVLDNIILVKV